VQQTMAVVETGGCYPMMREHKTRTWVLFPR